MHALKVIAGGARPGSLPAGAKFFLPLWLVAAAVNLWLGVSRAGYSVAEEAPVFLVVFGVPPVVAAVLWWRFAGS